MIDKFKPAVCGVGYRGEGPHNSVENEEVYKTWASMLWRCYSSKAGNNGCTVHPDWHNFQTFAQWYAANHPKFGHSGFEIDKQGAKVYGPDTCKFSTRGELRTNAHSKQYQAINPEGEVVIITRLKRHCVEHGLNYNCMLNMFRGRQGPHRGWRAVTHTDER